YVSTARRSTAAWESAMGEGPPPPRELIYNLLSLWLEFAGIAIDLRPSSAVVQFSRNFPRNWYVNEQWRSARHAVAKRLPQGIRFGNPQRLHPQPARHRHQVDLRSREIEPFEAS